MSSEKKIVTLKTSDGEIFEVEVDVITQSQTIKHLIEDDCANEFIPVPNVDGKALSKVIEYCKKHCKSAELLDEKTKDEIQQWDREFMKKMEMKSVMALILVANYLEVKGLLDLTAQKIADDIKDKSVEEVRKIFNIENDFTPEEEEKLKKEHGWTHTQ